MKTKKDIKHWTARNLEIAYMNTTKAYYNCEGVRKNMNDELRELYINVSIERKITLPALIICFNKGKINGFGTY